MDRSEILSLLKEEAPDRLEGLWAEADRVRRDTVGDEVHLRGLVEISNHCVRHCAYCGLRRDNRKLRRYRMAEGEILASAMLAVELGYGATVLQSGEDYGIDATWLARIIRRIKAETPLAVTLSLGERPESDLGIWREAGADRYLLRFETSNGELYRHIHPPIPGRSSDRIAIIRTLLALGYETGSGVMIGLPGQTYEDLARDIETFGQLGLEMIGVGPYIPHPETPLGRQEDVPPAGNDRQVPNSELMTYKVLALTRITCPLTNIPSTTALATLNEAEGRQLGLMRGANVVMPNLTPMKYRECYEIYPGKACLLEAVGEFDARLKESIAAMGRKVGRGRGDSPMRKRGPTGGGM